MLLSVLKILGLCLSFAGWMYWFKRWLRVDFCFVPAAVFSTAAVVVYGGGILFRLEQAAWLVYGGGLLAFAAAAVLSVTQHEIRPPHLHLREVCFGAGSLIFLSTLPGTQFQHYDNFSHWGIVVKQMLSTSAFPTLENKLIDFLNYPLGTSSFLYYVCYYAGHRSGTMLLAQGILIFAFFYAVLGAVRHTRSFLLYAMLGAGLSVLSFFNLTIRINNLLVDFLLPVIALACWAVIRRYPTEPEKMLPLLLPYQALLLIVKSTGPIYVAFVVLAYLFRVPRAVHQLPASHPGQKHPVWRALLLGAFTLLLSSVTWAAWQYHTKTALSGAVNKFSTNLVEVGAAGTGKTSEQLHTILQLFLRSSVDLSTRPALGFVLLNLLALGCGIGFWFRWKYSQKRFAVHIFLLDAMVVLYYAGILLLYLFPMPANEALVLAGFDRYACSIIVLFAGGVVLQLEEEVEEHLQYAEDGTVQYAAFQEKNRYQKCAALSLALLFGILASEYNGTLYTQQQESSSLPHIMQEVTGDRWPADGKEDTTRYLLYGSDSDGQMTSHYFQYVARYYLYAPNVDAVCSFSEDNLAKLLRQYDCLVVVEPDQTEQAMLKKHFGVDGSAGFYRIETSGTTVRLVAE